MHYTMHIISYATTAQSPFQMVVKSNTVSLRHNHSPETLIIHITQCIRNHFAFKILFSTKFYFQKFYFLKILFFKNFIKIYLILFEFNNFFFEKILFYNERCSFGDSGKKTSQNGSKMGRVHRVHCPRPAQAPRPPARPKHARLSRAPCTPSTHALRAQPAPSQPIASHNTILLYCSQKLAISVMIQFFCIVTLPSQPAIPLSPCNTKPSCTLLLAIKL